MMTDIRTLLHRTTRELTAGGSPSPRLDAEVLLMNFLKTDRLQLYHASGKGALTEEECAGFSRWVDRTRRGEPVAYIIGEKEFWSLLFEVNRDVLIPRPETECLIEEVLKYYGREAGPLRIIDIGTGSGAIGVVLAAEIPAAHVTATDISRGALEVARRNADRHGVAGRMEFLQGDLFASASENLTSSFPTRLTSPMTFTLCCRRGSGRSSPARPLSPVPTAPPFTGEIIREGTDRLKPGGRIFLEIGEGQKGLVDSLFREGDAIRTSISEGLWRDGACRVAEEI